MDQKEDVAEEGMGLEAFGERIDADPSYELALVDVENRFVVVHVHKSGAFWKLLVDAINIYTEKEIFDTLNGLRPRRPIYHVSRIVGYFSRIEDWNASKIAELADRGRGDYMVDGTDAKWKERV